MSLSIFMKYFFSYYTVLGFIPAAVLCYMPMVNQLRFPVKKVIRDCVILFIISYAGLQFLSRQASWLDETVMMIPFLVVVFIYYIFSVKTLLSQCAAIFVCACTLCAIPASLMYLVSGLIHAEETLLLTLIYQVIELALMALISVAFMPGFYRTGRFLINDLQRSWIWTATIPYSLITFFVLVILTRDQFQLMQTPVGIWLYIIIASAITALYLFSIVFFASICKHILEEERLRTRDTVYRIQKKQYEDVHYFLERMHVYRHDSRHTLRTIAEMARAGDVEAIRTYLGQKQQEMPDVPIRTFCDNSILNAVLNYYLEDAERSDITADIKIDLPEVTERQAVDLSSVFANLLENAILACREIPKEERQMALTVRTVNKKTIYIVSTNRFSGTVKIRRGEYQSTRIGQGGSGIGLRSMRGVTERYDGTMKVYHEGKKFFVDIMMHVDAGKEQNRDNNLNILKIK